MDITEIENTLKAHRKELDGFGVISLKVFGSVARNEATELSDIDLIVEFKDSIVTLIDIIELGHFLEELFKRKIDIGTENSLKKNIKEEILKGAIRVA